jgi:DNA (cytosine-5)-methyltransferase 1
VAGKQLGADDERDLFPAMLDLLPVVKPRAVMIENVPGLAQTSFEAYRADLLDQLASLGYHSAGWRIVQASDFGVPQLRPRFVLVAFASKAAMGRFTWPAPSPDTAPTVGEALLPLMNGWPGAGKWARERATRIAPTLVGGSKKHGGPDLGPTRAKKQWADLGVNGHLIANAPPTDDLPTNATPHLTVEMAAVIQGFPVSGWPFAGPKTHAYRQVGNAFPPPVARALGGAIAKCLRPSSHAEPRAPLTSAQA